MMSISSSSDLCKNINPIFYFSRIFGLAPFSLQTLSISLGAILYSVSLTVLLIYSEIHMFKIIFSFNLLPKIGKILVFLEQIHFTANMFISWVVAIFNFDKLIDVIKGFTAVENLFKRLNVNVQHKSHVSYQILQIIIILIIILVTFILDYILNGLRIGFVIASAINIIVLVQFLDFVLLYRFYFSILNKQLSILGTEEENRTDIKYDINTGTEIVYHIYNKNFIANIDIRTNTDECIIKIVRETHRFLYCLHNDFNSFYSLQLLCSVSSSILTIIAALYYFALYAISGLDLYYEHYSVGILNSGFTALYNFVKLLVLVHICTSTTDEVNNTSVLIHLIMNDQKIATNLQNELHLFSNQLMHQKVVFTACGFFNLDFTLISAVIGAVSTYMVILIQFQITS